jgi:hypothetical protein
MSFKPPSTKGVGLHEPHKLLLYGHHGWGKTWQVRTLQKRYGKGVLLSGEAGLKSLSDVEVDYVPFTSFDGTHEPTEGVFSFRGLAGWINSADFRAEGYKWIALDSLTELSDMIYDWAVKEAGSMETRSGKANGFVIWDLYGQKMLGTLKWIRDLKMHVYVTCLASEGQNDEGNSDYWPMVKGSKVAKNIPAIFDHVFCAVRKDQAEGDSVSTKRFIITEQLMGWHGKARDPHRRLAAIEACDDVTELLERMTRTEEEHEEIERKRAEVLRNAQAIAEAQKKGTPE